MTWPEYCDHVRELVKDIPDTRVDADDQRRVLTIYASGPERHRRANMFRLFLPDLINFGTANAQIKIMEEEC